MALDVHLHTLIQKKSIFPKKNFYSVRVQYMCKVVISHFYINYTF